MENEIILIQDNQELSILEVQKQIIKIQNLMKAVMKENEHYGKIPGIEKETLYKAGAEKICFTFKLVAEFAYFQTNLDNNHREYRTECKIYTMEEHKFVGQGVGICSTMESKYRYRNSIDYLNESIPQDYWDNRKEYNKNGFVAKKINGIWQWCRQTGERQENPDIADQYNTVIKMSEKRAYVDATIRATAASDVFTQDIEDTAEGLEIKQKNQPENEKNINTADNTIEFTKENQNVYANMMRLINEKENNQNLFTIQEKIENKKKADAVKTDIEQLKAFYQSINQLTQERRKKIREGIC